MIISERLTLKSDSIHSCWTNSNRLLACGDFDKQRRGPTEHAPGIGTSKSKTLQRPRLCAASSSHESYIFAGKA